MTVPAKADPVRITAADVLTAVAEGRFLDEALDAVRSRFPEGSPENARLLFLTAGTTKLRMRLDHELDARLRSGLSSVPPRVRAILRLALFEMRHADVPSWAAVDAAVEATRAIRMSGLTGVVNGVLRAAEREGEPPLPADEGVRTPLETSHPAWLLEAVAERWGPEAARALAAWDNAPPPLWVRVDTSRVPLLEALEALQAAGAEPATDGPLPGWIRLGGGIAPGRLEGVREGWLTVQDPSAALASLATGPGAGEILDLCAAPGGKTGHLAERLEPGGRITATDSDPQRLERLRENMRRHGAGGVTVVAWEEVLGVYDAVLVDAPCSNLGVLRRRADARWRVQPETVREMAAVQEELLTRAAELVRPGGVLVYSTCTILPDENDGVVAAFLEGHPGFAPEDLPADIPDTFRDGVGVARSLPWVHAVDGAFAARLRRGTED